MQGTREATRADVVPPTDPAGRRDLARKNPAQLIVAAILYALILGVAAPALFSPLGLISSPILTVAYLALIPILLTIWLLAANFVSLALFSTGRFVLGRLGRHRHPATHPAAIDPDDETASVAILYLTCNDFDPDALRSCLDQDWPRTRVYVLDDSTTTECTDAVDEFVAEWDGDVELVRRERRTGFKAGNINHGVRQVTEEFTVICDADQRLPPSFVRDILPDIVTDDRVGYVQGLHRVRSDQKGEFLARALGYGIFLFWHIVLPVRDRFGFPMFLGHGGIVRTRLVKDIGFPEIVAEDLAFSVAVHEAGYRGTYARTAESEEAFPRSIAEFRKRHMKWVRGTCEFLSRYTGTVVRSRRLPAVAKWDIFISLVQVPAGALLVLLATIVTTSTFVLHQTPDPGVHLGCDGIDVFDCWPDGTRRLAMIMVIAPFLPFGLPLLVRPLKFVRFFLLGIAVYVAMIPITFFGMLGYLFDGKADFLTTGDKDSDRNVGGLFRNPNGLPMLIGEGALGATLVLLGWPLSNYGVIGLGIAILMFSALSRLDLTTRTLVPALVGPALCTVGFLQIALP